MSTGSIMTAERDTAERDSTPPRRTERLVEVAVLLLFIVPGNIMAYFVTRHADSSFALAAIGSIAHNVALVSLIRFFLWREGEPAAEIGWRFKNRWGDVLIGVALFAPLFGGARLLEEFLRALGLSGPAAAAPAFLAGRGPAEALLSLLMVAVVAFAEETIFRGYLISRFKALTAKVALALLLSSFVFALGHGYEGVAGMITVGAMGAVYALVYLWRGSLVAPMVAHFLQDVVVIVLLPLLR